MVRLLPATMSYNYTTNEVKLHQIDLSFVQRQRSSKPKVNTVPMLLWNTFKIYKKCEAECHLSSFSEMTIPYFLRNGSGLQYIATCNMAFDSIVTESSACFLVPTA